MNPNSTSNRPSRRLTPLLLGVSALALFSASCTCAPVAYQATPMDEFQYYEAGRKNLKNLDLPVDYLGADYRALYRSDPNWFRYNGNGPGAPDSYYYSK